MTPLPLKTGLSVFMYHDVREENPDYYPRRYALKPFLTPSLFQEHLDYIEREYDIISWEGLSDTLAGLEGSDKKALLTFDDGLKDHVSVAYPILKERGLSAIFFLPAEAVRDRVMVHSHKIQFILAAADEAAVVEEIFEALKICSDQIEIPCPRQDEIWDEYSRSDRPDGTWSKEMVFTTRLLREFRSYDFRSRMLARLFSILVSDDERAFTESFYMTESDAQELARNEMGIGAHGFHSLNALHETYSLQESEIRRSYDFIRGEVLDCQHPEFFYSFPNGGYTSRSLSVLEELGCTGAFTTKRVPYVKGTVLEIPRLDGPQDLEFAPMSRG